MRRYLVSLLMLGGLVGTLASCAEQQPAINRVQAYALPKSLFQGEWFFNQTVVDVPSTRTVTFEGETTFMATHRVRWDIQENYLYARVSYEKVQGGKTGESQDSGEYKGEIVGAWRIETHFDVRRSYNPTTGEEINVLEENAHDQRWFDRKYMRVDWSQNLATDYNFLVDWDTLAPIKRDPVPYYDWNSSDPRFRPIFDEVGGYIDFTSAMAVAPSTIFIPYWNVSIPVCYLFSGQDASCQTEVVKIRNSFLRRDYNRDYEPKMHKGTKDEWFGYFVTERWNWDPERGIEYPNKDQFMQRHGIFSNYHYEGEGSACTSDNDCKAKSPDSKCDKKLKFHKFNVETDSDADGLPDAFEATVNGLDAKSADSDGDGVPDGRDDANGNGLPDLQDAYKWDQANLEFRCLIPLKDREPRPVAYFDTGKFPRSVVCDELENDPSKDNSTEPCKPWVFTADAKARDASWSSMHWASNTYDDAWWKIYLRGAYNWSQADYEKWIKVKNAGAFGGSQEQQDTLAKFGDDAHGWYAFVICPNNPVTADDPWPCRFPHHTFAQAKEMEAAGLKFNPLSYAQAKKLVDAGQVGAIEQKIYTRPGDIRYSMVHYAKDYSAVSPLGYGPSAYDARTGEILAGTANIYSAMDWYATYMQEVIDLLNGKMSPTDWVNGVALDKWLQRMKEATTAKEMQPTTYSYNDLQNMYKSMTQEWMKGVPKLGSPAAFETMKDANGNLLNNRQLKVKLLGLMRDSGMFDPAKKKIDISAIKGTPLEKQMMDHEILLASGFQPGQVKELTPDILDQASIARGGFIKKLAATEALRFEISNRRNLDFAEPDALLDEGLASLAYRIAQKFPNEKDPKKIWAFIRRLIFRPVVEHEMGHTVGFMHNFGGSDDAMNFPKEYWQLRTNDWADKNSCSYKNPAAGQLCPFFLKGKTNYQLGKDAKNLQQGLKGIEDYAYTSIMDYDYWPTLMGQGLARYDIAALMFGYADKVEVFKDPGLVPAGLTAGSPNVFDEYFTGNGQVLMLYSNRAQSFHYTNWYTQMKDKLWDESNRELVPDSKMQVDTTGGRANGWFYVDGTKKYPRVPYIYCSHNRANISESCMTWDWGADEYERMKMHTDQWDYWYPISAFTRYRYGASVGGYINRRYSRFYHRLKNFNNTYALYQGLFHQWYDQTQINDFFTDPVNGYGAYTAAMHDGFNAAMRTIAMPDVKGFKALAEEPDGQKIHSESIWSNEEIFATDITNARYFTTSWYDTSFNQSCGYEWWECLHHMGFYLDKILAMIVLSDPMTYFVARDTAEDIRQWRISFFDNFQKQIIDFYGGMLAEDYDQIAPWYDPNGKKVVWRNYAVQDTNGNFGPVKPAGGGATEAATRFTLQLYAAVFGLFEFQGNFDNEFVERARMWKQGKGTTWTVKPTEKIDGVAEYVDPWAGTTYVGVAYKDKRGIAQRMIAHANTLKGRTKYCTTSGPDVCVTVSPTVQANAEAALTNYRQLMDVVIQATSMYDTFVHNWSWDPFDP